MGHINIFYGIILCVDGLGTLGYLELVSNLMYQDLECDRGKYLGWLSFCNNR